MFLRQFVSQKGEQLMNGKSRSLLAFLLFFVFAAGIVNAQDEDPALVNPQHFLLSADEEIFKRPYFSQDFSEDQGYVNEFPNKLTVHQYYIYDGVGSDVLMTMYPSKETVHTTNKRLRFDQYRMKDFHVKYSVTRTENIPDEGGGLCWIRYSNELLRGAGRDSGLLLYPGGDVYAYSPVDGVIVYKQIADLSDLDPEVRTDFDFIRLDGNVYVYVNGMFRFSYEDDITDAVSFDSGAELFEGGTRVHCIFDDFSMRIR